MTQEVQPLTWQKRTNLEEHQQFFSKINEIIANLAPTVAEAEAAIAQATQAIASANAAIATANAASANADAASQQAQTAANTVAGYDTRMSAVESKNTQQDTAISALQTADGQNVKLTENQDITGIKTVPTEATGARSQQIANSAKVGAELDNYAHMLRTTGDQNFSGIKNTTSNFIGTYYGANGIDKSSGFVIAERDTGVDIVTKPTISRYFPPLLFEDGAGHRVGGLRIVHNTNGTCSLYVTLRNADGTSKNIMLATSDP